MLSACHPAPPPSSCLARRLLALSALAALPLQARAQALAERSPLPAGELAGNLVQMVIGLAIVIALLIACLWLIRHLSAPRGSAAATIKVLGATALGPRERLVLVRIGEEVLVLGVAPGRVSTLHRMSAEDLQAASLTTDQENEKLGSFASWLKKAREHRADHHAH